ncbi:MAG: dienelactone hydrolase family protein [Deltaproteobacteria bacterium]|nr:dienelactone hydrolase family protein [Deltaproteobacteria bacterium]
MLIREDFVDLETPAGIMRTHRFQPTAGGPYPGVVLFSEIYQVTTPIARTARRLAGQGYLVAVPEVYHEFEPLGCALAYDKEGTDKGNRYKTEKTLAAYDDDARAVIAHLLSLPTCSGRLGAMGICLGGHLAFRCAMNREIVAAACLYATDIHKRGLGKGMNDDSLDRIPELGGEMLMIWGRQDPHIPQEGRDRIYRALVAAGTNFTWHEFNASHAFVRDEGFRYDAALAEICYALTGELFHRRLQMGNMEAPRLP